MCRRSCLKTLESYTLEQLNKIPDGYNNNLIWNIAHILVTQEVLTYKLSGLPTWLPNELVEKYRKDTKPEKKVTQEDVDQIKSLLLESVDKLEDNYEKGVFSNFKEYPTSSGFVLKNIDDALNYSIYHEGLHIGTIAGIKKFI